MRLIPLFLLLAGCADSIQYTVGSGVVYQTRCAAKMSVEGDTYEALCVPPACSEGFESVGISHVAVALDPGTKVIGNAERTCLQDIEQLAANPGITVDGQPASP